MDDKSAAGSTEAPATSFCDNYAEELEHLLLLHQENQDENQDIPEPLTSAGHLGAFQYQSMCTSKKVNKVSEILYG